MNIVRGKVHKYGDDVNTDVIIPARYLTSYDPAVLAAHCMEDIDSGFAGTVIKGDIIVGGKNFGCGSSREHAPLAIKYSGIALIIAESMARIFYQNAINTGLAVLECTDAAKDAETGDVIEVELGEGIITNITKNKRYAAVPFPPFIRELIDCGGLMNYIGGKSGKQE